MANSTAHPLRAGFNQSGGAYFVCIAPLCAGGKGKAPVTPSTTVPLTTPTTPASSDATFLYNISVAGSKSGGAFEPATLVPVSAQDVFGADTDARAANVATELGAGKLIRDMGKTIVDKDGQTFRKFAVAGTGARYLPSFGVAGSPAVAPGAGYGTFYLKVGREGATGKATTGTTAATISLPAPIARYF